jgi:hypothetical protein
MQVHEDREQDGQRDARRRLCRSSRQRSKSLVWLHVRLRSGLGGFQSRGELWVLVHRSYPFVVLRNRPFFDDSLALTSEGRRVVSAIGKELAGLPGIYSLITGHVDLSRDGSGQDALRVHAAWQQARGVENVLIEAGADPARLLSVGLVKCENDVDREIIDELAPGPPFVITICFTTKSDDLKDPRRRRIDMD